jgi:four helix bundle protein
LCSGFLLPNYAFTKLQIPYVHGTRKITRIVKLYRSLPDTADSQVVGKQLLRCGTSVAANYRAACRGRSRAEWTAKIGLVVEEADETVFWLEMLSDCGITSSQRCEDILKEAHELSAIFTATQHPAKRAG